MVFEKKAAMQTHCILHCCIYTVLHGRYLLSGTQDVRNIIITLAHLFPYNSVPDIVIVTYKSLPIVCPFVDRALRCNGRSFSSLWNTRHTVSVNYIDLHSGWMPECPISPLYLHILLHTNAYLSMRIKAFVLTCHLVPVVLVYW